MLRLKILLQSNYFYYALLIFSLILCFFRINFIKRASLYDLNNTKVVGIITNIKKSDERFTLEIKAKEKLIGYYNSDATFKLGDKVLLEGELYEPLNNTIPNTFNYKKYLNNNRIYYLMRIKSLEIIVPNKNIFYRLKQSLQDHINSYEKTNHYLSSFITGNKSHLDDDTYNNFIYNGVVHLFSISGMHINFISALVLFLVSKINLKTIIKFIIAIFIIIFFGFLVNYSASVSRSILFFIFIYLNKHYDFNITTKNILFLVVSILILINPKIIFNVGFQYSVIATYGLIISNNKKRSYFNKMLYSSFIASLFCLPITLINNYEFNFLTPFNNLLFIPLITLIIFPLSLLTLCFRFLEPPYYLIIVIMEKLNNLLASVKMFNVIIPKVSFIFYLLYFILIIIYMYSYNKKYLYSAILLIFAFKLKPLLDQNTYVYYLDVNQGDSTLIYNRKETILIDTGGVYNYDISNNTILFFKSLGITKIDLLILTHGDYDHMGETINLVENFKVEKVIFNCGKFNELEQDLINVLDKKKIPYYSCIKDLNIDNNKLYFLNNKIYNNENDNSSVIYTELNNHKFLFMGDASVEVEEDLIKKYNLQDIDVLKAGHHGSKTSSSKKFIDSINPKYSIISVGKNNRYGHPNKEVLNILDNSKIYRTDQDGSVRFKVKNNKLQIETCPP